MEASYFDFGPWLPDLGEYRNPGVYDCDNVYPRAGGYAPFKQAVGTGDTTTEIVRGAELFLDKSDNPVVVAGSATRLAVRTTSALTETTGYTTLSDGDYWRFARFENYIIAVTPNNAPQYLTDVTTDTTWSALPGSPPKAAEVGRVGNFLVMGNLTDIDASTQPQRIRWSALNSPVTAWVTDLGELSDFRDLPAKYGRVTGIVGGRFGLVFQERAIWRMTFVGAPKVFDLEVISADRGCPAPGSIVTVGYQTFFLSQDGFYLTNGSELVAIGQGKVNQTFSDDVAAGIIDRVHGSVNWPEKCVVWAYPPNGATTFSAQIVYSWETGEWSRGSLTGIQYLVQTKIEGLTLGDLDAIYATLGDAAGTTLGNPEWLARDLALAAFVDSGAGGELAVLNGDAAACSLTTGSREVTDGRYARVTGLKCIHSGTSTAEMALVQKTGLGATATTTAVSTAANDGFAPFNRSARFMAVSARFGAGADTGEIRGYQVRVLPEGVY